MKKKVRSHLTSERLRKRFTSQFDLVNYAIQIAENVVSTGRDVNVKTEVQNPAYNILEEIALHKEVFAEPKQEEQVAEYSGPMTKEDIIRAVEAKKEQQKLAT